MKQNYLFFSCMFFFALARAQSPISLNNTHMPGSGDTLRYTVVQMGSLGNYTQTGVNFNWNFGAVVSTTQGVREFKSPLQTPYMFFFSPINDYGEKIADQLGAGPLVISDYYNFYKKQPSPQAFIADGAGITFTGIPVPSYYTDKDELYNFPMTYPKYDSTTFRFATPATTMIPVRYSKTGYRVTRVDGWGTVTTPYGTENCLRLVTTQYAMDTIKISFNQLPLPALGFPNVVRSYQWLSLTSKIPVMEITGNLTGNNFLITQARYRGYPKPGDNTGLGETGTGNVLPLYPNPVRSVLHLPSGFVNAGYEIHSMEGKCLRRISADFSGSAADVDVSDLPAGAYLLKVREGERVVNYRFVREEE